ncbi:MAG: PD40 domain-containing protein [Planctomycetes bacterium]|nr:PD40 domain-containing protein [Planctomycetota bacterium]
MDRLLNLVSAVALVVVASPLQAQGLVELASRSTSGAPADGDSYRAAISGDGNVVAFVSAASNLSAHPTAVGSRSVFVRDRALGTSEMVAVTIDGSAPNQGSGNPSLSHDGRYVLFSSIASNLVAQDANGQVSDLFVRDRALGTTVLASLTSQGTQSASTIHAGRISGDGNWIVFESAAADIVPGDTNGVSDVFVRNLQTGAVERVSLRADGTQALAESRDGSLSHDGSRVAFSSFDPLLPADTDPWEDVYVLDRSTGVLVLASVGAGLGVGEATGPFLSADGSTVAFSSWANDLVPGDTNNQADVFWRDLVTATTGRASVRSTGAQLGTLSWHAAISGDGRIVGFWTTAEVVPGTPAGAYHLYTHDRVTGATTLADAAPDALPGDGWCEQNIALSDDGRWVAFASDATNLVLGDLLGSDVFVRERASASPTSYCSAKVNSLGCTPQVSFSGAPSASSGAPFTLSATHVLGGQFGLLFYGLTPQNVPFQAGRRCVAPPIRRTALVAAGGTVGSCSGVLTFDFNALVASGLDARLVVGAVVHAQFWYRDPADPNGFGSGLSDAAVFAIQP